MVGWSLTLATRHALEALIIGLHFHPFHRHIYIYIYNFRIVEIYVQDTIKIFPRDESEFRYIFSYDLEKTGIVINNLIISRSMAKGEKDEGWRGGREETKRYSTRFPFARSF